jgi:hypothetical protein
LAQTWRLAGGLQQLLHLQCLQQLHLRGLLRH